MGARAIIVHSGDPTECVTPMILGRESRYGLEGLMVLARQPQGKGCICSPRRSGDRHPRRLHEEWTPIGVRLMEAMGETTLEQATARAAEAP